MIGIFQRRTDLHVAAAGIDLRVDRRNFPGKYFVLERIDLHGDRLSETHLSDCLLRHKEVRENRIKRLERDDHGPGPEILSEVYGANAEVPGKRRT